MCNGDITNKLQSEITGRSYVTALGYIDFAKVTNRSNSRHHPNFMGVGGSNKMHL